MNISAKCTATDSLLGMPPQLHVHTNICSANHISEFSVCRCVDMAKMTYLSSNRMRAFPHHPCLQRLLWKRSNILWAAVFWTKMTSWHQSSEENAQTAAEEHLWMDRTLKLEADGLLQHWVPPCTRSWGCNPHRISETRQQKIVKLLSGFGMPWRYKAVLKAKGCPNQILVLPRVTFIKKICKETGEVTSWSRTADWG